MSPVATDEDPKNVFEYRILRYMPNQLRDEWVNIGVLLQETSGARRAMRLIEEPAEFARVRRVHPEADENLLRSLYPEFDARLRASVKDVELYLEKLDQNLSTVLQFSPPKGLLADNFDAELDRLTAEYAGLDARQVERCVPAASHSGEAGAPRARGGIYAAGGSDAAGLRLSEWRARIYPVGFFAARFAAG
jgi:hypothetical protein